MNHADVRGRMADYLEGDLVLSERALFDGHLDGCESCSHEFTQLRDTVRLLRSLPDPQPPALLVENVMRRIRSGEGSVRLLDHIRAGLSLVARPQLAVPATALAIGLTLASGKFEDWQLVVRGFVAEPARSLAALGSEDGRVPTSQRTVADGVKSQRPNDPAALRLADNRTLVPEDSPVVADGLRERRRREADSNPARTIRIVVPPPAVARAPRISIQIPIGRTDAKVGATRVVTAWQPRSVLTAARPFASSAIPRTEPAANRVLQPSRLDPASVQGSVFTPLEPGAERERRKRAELDGRLDRMIGHPALFSREFASLTTTEQEIWLQALAEYALTERRGQEAIRSLRQAASPITLELATAFSAELRRMRKEERPEVASALEQR